MIKIGCRPAEKKTIGILEMSVYIKNRLTLKCFCFFGCDLFDLKRN